MQSSILTNEPIETIAELYTMCSGHALDILYAISEEHKLEELIEYLNDHLADWTSDSLSDYISDNDEDILRELEII